MEIEAPAIFDRFSLLLYNKKYITVPIFTIICFHLMTFNSKIYYYPHGKYPAWGWLKQILQTSHQSARVYLFRDQ